MTAAFLTRGVPAAALLLALVPAQNVTSHANFVTLGQVMLNEPPEPVQLHTTMVARRIDPMNPWWVDLQSQRSRVLGRIDVLDRTPDQTALLLRLDGRVEPRMPAEPNQAAVSWSGRLAWRVETAGPGLLTIRARVDASDVYEQSVLRINVATSAGCQVHELVMPLLAPHNTLAIQQLVRDPVFTVELEFAAFTQPPTTTYPGVLEAWTDLVFQRMPGEFQTFGTGCAGQFGVPVLDAGTNVPRLGQPFPMTIGNLCPTALNVAWGVVGAGNTWWNGQPLPVDLGIVGMPGCMLWIEPFPGASQTLTNLGGTALWSLPIPLAAPLAGLTFYVQAMALEPGANPLGATVTNAGVGVIGV